MNKKTQMVEAVLFFDERGICKEMFYAEFEAILDGVVNLPEFADRQVRAVYVLVDTRLMVRAAVFFHVDFLDEGEADKGWNLPLRNLAERGGRGPDLGAGPIRLACRSQCPIAWHQMHLWDPGTTAGQKDLALIRDRIRRNQLRLRVEDEQPAVVTAERLHMVAEDKWYSAGLSKSVTSSELEQELGRLRQTSEQEQNRLRKEMTHLQQRLYQLDTENEALRGQLAEQAEGFRRRREEMTAQLRQIESGGRADAKAVRAEVERSLQARHAAELEQQRQRVSALEAELDCRNQLDVQVQGEVERLVRERDELARQSGARLLERLTRLGVNFVVYHPGAGQFSIPSEDIERYQENPIGYAASRCSLSEALYRQWLEHYLRPACQASMKSGERCAIPVDRIESPNRFVPGISDCCSRHRAERSLAVAK